MQNLRTNQTKVGRKLLGASVLFLGLAVATSSPAIADTTPSAFEQIPEGEAAQIENIGKLTVKQMENRPGKPAIRNVHAKDHGCVKALFEVLPDLPEKYRAGIFAEPGKRYEALIRFSNAAALVGPDSGTPKFGSRGMAIKLTGVSGKPLLENANSATQDFLMVNHPVFVFSDVADYEAASEVLAKDGITGLGKSLSEKAKTPDATGMRAKRSLGILARIGAPTVAEGAYQPQPASPVDCRYFSGAPFQFGDKYAMKFAATPIDAPADPKPDFNDPDYLRNALIKRLKPDDSAKPVQFQFQVQLREPANLNIATDIEDACTVWCETDYPFVTVATITIPPQEFNQPEQKAACEAMVFSPWNGVQEHRPLGGINRVRRAAYEASVRFRSGK